MAIRSINEIRSAEADTEVGSEIPASLREVITQIDEYRHLGPNWDGEDALPVDGKVASRTKSLLCLIAAKARLMGLPWQDPSVAPNPDGGLELTWEREDRWTMLVIEPGLSKIGCSAQEGGDEPRFRLISRAHAIEKALWALGG